MLRRNMSFQSRKSTWGQQITSLLRQPRSEGRADLVVCDVIAQCKIGGELQHMMEGAQGVLELGALTAGTHPFLRKADAVTVCDLTGTGAQDTAIAVEAYARVRTARCGTRIG